jgi:predicted RNase H-like HicB family nuclease
MEPGQRRGASVTCTGGSGQVATQDLEVVAVVYEHAPRDWAADVPDLAGWVASGRIRAEVLRRFREAIGLHLDAMRARGEAVPETSAAVEVVEV